MLKEILKKFDFTTWKLPTIRPQYVPPAKKTSEQVHVVQKADPMASAPKYCEKHGNELYKREAYNYNKNTGEKQVKAIFLDCAGRTSLSTHTVYQWMEHGRNPRWWSLEDDW